MIGREARLPRWNFTALWLAPMTRYYFLELQLLRVRNELYLFTVAISVCNGNPLHLVLTVCLVCAFDTDRP